MRAGEPPAKAAAQMIRQALADVKHDEPARHTQARQHADPPDHDGGGRPPWLEPYGGSREWCGLTWAAIVGLRTRYPEALSALREGWWQNASHLETLSALATWRQSIDNGGRDPREELSFQIQLANYGKLLQPAERRHPRPMGARHAARRMVVASPPPPRPPQTEPHRNLDVPSDAKKPHEMGLCASGRYWA